MSRPNLLDRLCEYVLDGRGRVDELYAVWLLGGNCAKTLVDTLLEGHALSLHAICRATGCHAQRRLLGRDVIDERERRVRTRDGQVVGIAHHLTIEAIGKRLVAGRGIVEAIAQDHLAGSKGGRDDLVHQLSACRLVEQQLAGVAHRRIGRVEQQSTDLFADGGTARLAQAHNLVASELERTGKQARLRRFTGAIDTLERNEAMLSGLKSHGRSPFLQGA